MCVNVSWGVNIEESGSDENSSDVDAAFKELNLGIKAEIHDIIWCGETPKFSK